MENEKEENKKKRAKNLKLNLFLTLTSSGFMMAVAYISGVQIYYGRGTKDSFLVVILSLMVIGLEWIIYNHSNLNNKMADLIDNVLQIDKGIFKSFSEVLNTISEASEEIVKLATDEKSTRMDSVDVMTRAMDRTKKSITEVNLVMEGNKIE